MAFSVAGAGQETCLSEMLGGPGAAFWYDLASLFRGRRSTLDKWNGKFAKRIGTRPPFLHSTFHF